MPFILKPVDKGTELTLTGNFVMPGGIFGKALYKLASGAAEEQIERALEKLKNIAEK